MTLRGNRRRAQSWPVLGQSPYDPSSPNTLLSAVSPLTYVRDNIDALAANMGEETCPSGNVPDCVLFRLKRELMTVTQAQQSRLGGKEYP